jgi:hypothetical protein
MHTLKKLEDLANTSQNSDGWDNEFLPPKDDKCYTAPFKEHKKSPALSANSTECQDKALPGKDDHWWVSSPNQNGVYRWVASKVPVSNSTRTLYNEYSAAAEEKDGDREWLPHHKTCDKMTCKQEKKNGYVWRKDSGCGLSKTKCDKVGHFWRDKDCHNNPSLKGSRKGPAAEVSKAGGDGGAGGVDEPDEKGDTALIRAAKDGNHDEVHRLIKLNASVDGVNYKDETALYWASIEGRVEVAKVLLDNGADVNRKAILETENGDYGVTYLHLAAYEGYTDFARILIDAGADVDVEVQAKNGGDGVDEYSGRTALYLAVCNAKASQGDTIETVKVLLDHGADMNNTHIQRWILEQFLEKVIRPSRMAQVGWMT